MLQELPSNEMTLSRLERRGVSLAIDDFGLGASLPALRSNPFEELEIDRSFIAAIGRSGEDAPVVPPAPDALRRPACVQWPGASVAARAAA